MSRLSDREITLIQEARARSTARPQSVDEIVQRARSLQAAVLSHFIRKAASSVSRWTGLSALASLLDELVICPIRSALQKRRTVRELSRLDDHMLADIGLERGAIESFGEELSARNVAPGRAGESPLRRCRNWLKRRSTVRQLESLSDRQLDDIGIIRGEIENTVQKALLESTGTLKLARRRVSGNRVSAGSVQRFTRDTFALTQPIRVKRAAPAQTGGSQRKDKVPPMWLGPWLPMMPQASGR